MTAEEAIKKIDEGKIDEAYQFFCEDYKKTNNLFSKYYQTIIEFHYLRFDPNDLIKSFELLLGLPKFMHPQVLLPLISLNLDIEKYDGVIKYSKMAFDLGVDHPLLYSAYGKGLFKTKKNLNEALKYLDMAINHDDANIDLVALTFDTKMEILFSMKDYNEALRAVNQMYIKFGTKSFIDFERLKIATIDENNKDDIDEMFNNLKGQPEEFNAAFLMFEYYFHKMDALKIQYYGDLLLNNYPIDEREKAIIYIRLADIYSESDDELSISYLKKAEELNYFLDEVNHKLGEIYYFRDNYNSFKEAINYFIKAVDIFPHPVSINYLARSYYFIARYDLLIECIDKYKKILKKNKNYHYFVLLSEYYNAIGKHDKAMAYLRESAIRKQLNVDQYNYLNYRNSKNPNRIMRLYRNDVLEEKLPNKTMGEAYYSGLFGLDRDLDKALDYSNKALEEIRSNCHLSLIGSVYLSKGEYDKAFAYFKEGKEQYDENNDCSCPIAFYAYCMYLGLGVEMNKKEAFRLICDVIFEKKYCVGENLASLYCYMAMDLNIDLSDAYLYLKDYHERRHQTGIYYTLALAAKKLNIKKDEKLYNRLFRKSLKYASKEEVNYYSNNPTIPFMTHY